MKNLYYKLFIIVFKYPCKTQIREVLYTYKKTEDLKYKVAMSYVCGIDFARMSKWLNLSEEEIKFFLVEISKEAI